MADEPEKKLLPTLVAGAPIRPIIPQTFDDAYRLAKAVFMTGLQPKDMDSPERVMIAILHGMEIGLPPMMAVQKIAVINGRPTVWGDAALGLVLASPLCEGVEETIDGKGDARMAVCIAKRKGKPPVTRKFSVADAHLAQLWGKKGPWSQYPDRMLQMRARGFAIRDQFADVLGGLGLTEESFDGQMIDITAPPPPEAGPSHAMAEIENRAAQERQNGVEQLAVTVEALAKKLLDASTRAVQDEIFENEVEPLRNAGALGVSDYNRLVGLLKDAAS